MTESHAPDSGSFTEAAGAVGYPDGDAARAATLRHRQLAVPDRSLGTLEELSVWAAGVQRRCPPEPFPLARAVLVAADHGVAEAGVAGPPAGSAGELLELAGSGRAPVSAVAAGVPVRLLDVGVAQDTAPELMVWKVRRSSGRIDREDALSAAEVQRALAAGMAIADEELAAGADLLVVGSLSVAGSTPASTLAAVLTDTEPVKVVGRGDGIDDAAWIRKCAAIRDARRRAWPHRDDPERLLAVAGGADLAVLTGLLVQAARRQLPVLLDGLVPSVAALLAQLASPRVARWLCAGQLSGEPAHGLALRRLGLEPVLRLGIEVEQGVGALLALPVLRGAVRTLAETAERT